MEEKDFLTRYDNGEKFSEEELKELVWDFEQVEKIEGEEHRWQKEMTTIIKVDGRYFAIDWMKGLTEMQENEYYDQPYEVYPETTIFGNVTYSTEKPSNELITKEGLLALAIQQQIVEFEKQVKAIKQMEDELKEKILQEMEAKGIKSLKSDELSITYKEPTYRETFDSKELKADNEELYNKYIKISPVKASILLKVK